MALFSADIREIRRTVYGRDMREPIADAIEKVKRDHVPGINKRLTSVDTQLNMNVTDWIEYRPRTVYVNYSANNASEDGLAVSLISSDDYLLADSKSEDTASLISGEDYLLDLSGSGWAAAEMDYGSYVVIDEIPHHETYFLVLNIL